MGSTDHEGLDFSDQKYHQLHNTILVLWQYCLGITKPKSAFCMLPIGSYEIIIQWNFEIFYWLTNSL